VDSCGPWVAQGLRCAQEKIRHNSLALGLDMVMLILPGGIERTEQEYRFLLEQAGFQLSSITPTASVISVVEGKPM
jgi:hypothetical protein